MIGVFVGLFATRWTLAGAAHFPDGCDGGYTTFSTFSDVFYLIERGQSWQSAAYMVSSGSLSVGALIAALRLVRRLPDQPLALVIFVAFCAGVGERSRLLWVKLAEQQSPSAFEGRLCQNLR